MLVATCVAAALGIGALVARRGSQSGAEVRTAEAAAPDPGVPMPVATSATPTGPPASAGARPPLDGSAPEVAIRPQPPTARDLAAMVNEAALMVRLRQLGETDPPLTLRLAREGNARFPKSPDAPERAFIVVKSLVDMTRFKEAQEEARRMLKNYPNDPHTLDVERHLLSNPLE
jgi:hypothetical protein